MSPKVSSLISTSCVGGSARLLSVAKTGIKLYFLPLLLLTQTGIFKKKNPNFTLKKSENYW